MFNPALFKNPDEPSNQDDADSQPQGKKADYPVTGNPSRDSVRKLLYESFQGDV